MVINVFGCSYSHGVYPYLHDKISDGLRVNWVEKLAQKYDKFTFNNYAICGTSVAFSINQLLYAKEICKDVEHINIFQITYPNRFTTWKNQDIHQHRYYSLPNLTQFSRRVFSVMQRHTPGWLPTSRLYESETLFKEYYSAKSMDAFESEFVTEVEFIKNNSDFHFSWLPTIGVDTSISELLTEQQIEEFSLDSVNHFNDEGCQFVADWVDTTFLKPFVLSRRIK